MAAEASPIQHKEQHRFMDRSTLAEQSLETSYDCVSPLCENRIRPDATDKRYGRRVEVEVNRLLPNDARDVL